MVYDYINKQPPIESGLTETSCCYMTKRTDYYTGIKKHYTNIEKLIVKAHTMYNYQYLLTLYTYLNILKVSFCNIEFLAIV